MLDKCPKCGKNTLIKNPGFKIKVWTMGCDVPIAYEYWYECVERVKCGYESEKIREKIKL